MKRNNNITLCINGEKIHLIITFSPAGARKAKHSSSPLSTIVDRAPSTTSTNCKTETNMINTANDTVLIITGCALSAREVLDGVADAMVSTSEDPISSWRSFSTPLSGGGINHCYSY